MKAIFGILVLSGLILLPKVGGAENSELDAPAQFVAELNQLVQGVFSNVDDSVLRHESICRLIDTHADSVQMGTMALGRNRSRFTPEQMDQYQVAFRDMLAGMFESAFSKMQGAKIKISPRSIVNDNEAVVAVLVEAANRSPVRFQFYLAVQTQANQYRMIDAAMAGNRLIFSKRTSFERVMGEAPKFPETAAAQALIEDLKNYSRPCP